MLPKPSVFWLGITGPVRIGSNEMRRAVYRSTLLSLAVVVAGVLLIPGRAESQSVTPARVKPAPGKVYSLAVGTELLGAGGDVPGGQLPGIAGRRAGRIPAGAQSLRSAGMPAASPVTTSSVTLWTGAIDVVQFQSGGIPYAAVAFVPGLRIYSLSGAGDPVLIHEFETPLGGWRLAVEGTRLYMVDYLEEGIFVFDISSPSTTTQIGYISLTDLNRIADIDIEGNFLYLAAGSTGLVIIDVANPSSPLIYTPYYTNIGSGSVVDVAVAGGYAFITLGDTGEIQVVNVTSPSSPLYHGGSTYSGQTYEIVTHMPAGTFHSLDLVAAAGVDVSDSQKAWVDFYSWNPASQSFSLVSATSYITLTVTTGQFELNDIIIFENQAYLAAGGPWIAAMDIAGITSGVTPTYVGSTTGINMAYGVDVEPTSRSLLDTEVFAGLIRSTLMDGTPALSQTGWVGSGGHVYMSLRSENLLFVANGISGITVLDISDPANPSWIANQPTTDRVWDLEFDPPYLYVAEGNAGVSIFSYDDVSHLFTPHGNFPVTSGIAYDVILKENDPGAYQYLYVAQGLDGLVVLDISNPDVITQAGIIPFSGPGATGAYRVELMEQWQKLAVAYWTDGTQIYNITIPASPSFEASIPTANIRSAGVADADDLLAITDYSFSSSSISYYDISTSSPVLQGTYSSSLGSFRGLTSLETNGFLAAGWNGARVLNHDNPAGVFEETILQTSGYSWHVFTDMQNLFVSDYYSLTIGQIPGDLFLNVSPAGPQFIKVGDQLNFTASGGSPSYYYDTELHYIDDRTIATIDASGVLTGVAAGVTRVFAYGSAGKWGVSDPVVVMGGTTLIDDSIDETVFNLEDPTTSVFVPAGTFNEPVEIEIRTLNLITEAPAPPGGFEHLRAYDLSGKIFSTGTAVVSGDFNGSVSFTIHYDQAALPGGYDENSLSLWRYDDFGMTWIQQSVNIDPGNDLVMSDLSGFSFYSAMYSTVSLAAPLLTSPIGGQYVNVTDITLLWQDVAGATGYFVQVATDPGFAPVDMVFEGTVTSASALLTLGGPFEGQYYWRVQSSDGIVSSVFSTTEMFVADFTPPAVSVAALPSTAINDAVTIDAAATDNFELDKVRLHYRRTGDPSWQIEEIPNIGGNNYRGTVPGEYNGWDGFQYLVVATDRAGNEFSTTDTGPPGPGIVGGVTANFGGFNSPFTIPTNRWQMVSVPHMPDDSRITSILRGSDPYDNTVWRFFRWNNGDYQESSNISLQPGQAYWLYHTQANVDFDVGTGRTVFSGQPYAINIATGWNDIASPWFFSVPWDSILAASGLSDTDVVGVYTYQNNNWNLPGGAQEVPDWGGVSIYNRTGGIVTLRIPPVNAQFAGREETRAGRRDLWSGGDGGWRLQLVLSQEGVAGLDAQNFIGVGTGSADGWDPNDYPDPPISLEGTARLAVDHRRRLEDPGLYATDMIAGVDEGRSWPLLVESTEGRNRISLTVKGIESIPEGMIAVLVDEERNLRIDLDGTAPYTFYPAAESVVTTVGRRVERSFRLLVGTQVYVDGMTAGISRLPAAVELYPNYPNPFNSNTTIRFELREASRLRLVIHNVRGQRVKVIAEGIYNAGSHTVSWDGRDATGRPVATGIYLYQLEAEGVVRVRKMTLIK